MSTEFVLRDWRFGQTQSERLCASLLHSEGYDSVDPQNPLGGPDGGKDMLCEKGGQRYVAACYFPPTNQEFKSIKQKILHDSQGVDRNNAEGLVFFVNQTITPGQRLELSQAIEPNSLELYHIERMLSILNSPKGYGIRLEFLRIPMSNEEQLGLLSVINFRVDERLKEQSRELGMIRRSLQQVLVRTSDIAGKLTKLPSNFDAPDRLEPIEFPTSDLTISLLSWLHRIVTEHKSLPLANRGNLRTVEVWIGVPGKSREEAEFIPPPPIQVPNLIKRLLNDWRLKYPNLVGAPEDTVVQALAEFHHGILSIHPYLDGNGRLARLILQQQSIELLNKWMSARFTDDPRTYYQTLRHADKGNLEPLEHLISANLE